MARLSRALTVCAAGLAGSLALVTAAVATVPPGGAGAARGLDVSAFQHSNGSINWRQLARGGMQFVAVKVSESTYYTNPYYAADARAAAAAGLSVLPYVFANPRRSPGPATARFAVAAAKYRRGAARLPIEVDLENDPYTATDHTKGDCYGLRVPQMIAWITGFTAQTVALTGKWPIIYTTATWWRECTGNTARFRRAPLWLAAYDTARPGVPAPWKRWTFWQYDDATRLPGVGVTDVDYFHATAELPALRARPAPHPRPPGRHPAGKAKPRKAGHPHAKPAARPHPRAGKPHAVPARRHPVARPPHGSRSIKPRRRPARRPHAPRAVRT